MPKKDKDTKPAAKPAADKQMDPELEAKRSGPPANTVEPKPLADPDAGFEEPKRERITDPEPGDAALSQREIERKLTDPSFDPEGHERLRLAEESMSRPSDPDFPPTPFVDEHGDPMQAGERHPDRDPEGTHEGPKDKE